jgi:pimeloyl-ACP methyl ester carboxylesterase
MGVAVVAPDYLGLDGLGTPSDQLHPYVVAEPTALSSLDAVRAALKLVEREGTATRPDPSRSVLWGASQGGHAALWSDRYAGAYAPEITIAATVAAVPPTDTLALVEHGVVAFSDTTEGIVGYAIATADWYGLDPTEALLPEIAASAREVLDTTCDVLDAGGDVDAVEALFTAALRSAPGQWETTLPEWGCAFRGSSLTETPIVREADAPILMVLGEEDRLVPPGPPRADAGWLCDEGAAVELLECAGLDHEDAGLQTLDLQVDWVLARLAGEPLSSPCSLPPAQDCAP